MITQQSPGHSLAAHPGHVAAVTGHARLPPVREVPVSATLAANEAVAARRARLLMDRYGVATLPASAFGEPQRLAAAAGHRAALRRHPGTTERHTLTATDPLTLPWIAAALARLEDILTDLAGPANVEAATRERTTLRSGTGQA